MANVFYVIYVTDALTHLFTSLTLTHMTFLYFPCMHACYNNPSTIQYYFNAMQALTHAQIRRGAFNNSGSRDAGKDPYWDFKTGTRIQDETYTDMFKKDNPNDMEHGDKYVYDAKKTGGR